MAFIRTKNIKGRCYRYLVEGYREAGKVKHKTLKYLGAAPKLNKDAPTAVVLFAGGGGVECGLVEAGIRPITPLYSNGEKMVAKDNCPIFEAWADGNRQAIST